MKKNLLFLSFLILSFFSISQADWTLIPEGSGKMAEEAVEEVGKPGEVWSNYEKKAEKLEKEEKGIGTAFASGIFSWNIILEYGKYLAKLLSQIGLVIGAFMIIYAGYKFAMGVYTQDAGKGGRDSIKMAIYGVLVVIFSYAIINIMLKMFW